MVRCITVKCLYIYIYNHLTDVLSLCKRKGRLTPKTCICLTLSYWHKTGFFLMIMIKWESGVGWAGSFLFVLFFGARFLLLFLNVCTQSFCVVHEKWACKMMDVISKLQLQFLKLILDVKVTTPTYMPGAWGSGKISDRNWSKMQDVRILVWFVQYLSLWIA